MGGGGGTLADTGFRRIVHRPPKIGDVWVGTAPCAHQRFQFLLWNAHVQCSHRLQRTDRPAVAQGQLRDLAFLPQMTVDTMFFHRNMEHLGGGGAVDVAAPGEHLLPPLLPGDPGDDPCLDCGEVGHEEPAPRPGDKGGADQF